METQTQLPPVPPMEQFTPLIAKMAYMAYARAMGMGLPIDVDDLKQELAVTYLQCAKTYDATKGAKFMTFFIAAGWRNIEKLFYYDAKRRKHALTVSGDAPVSTTEEARTSLWELVSSGEPTPEQYLEGQDLFNSIMGDVSDIARSMVWIMVTQPDLVHEQLELLNEGAEQVRKENYIEEGVRRRGYEHVSFTYLARLFNLSPRETARVRREVEAAITHYYAAGV